MALHKDLTGSDLHEPKGADTAPSGAVYIANGSGSGVWASQYAGIRNLNQFWLNAYLTDISTPSTKAFFYVPVQAEIFELAATITATLTTGNSILSIYVNGVLFPDTLTVPFSGSAAGSVSVKAITTVNTIPAGSTVEIRTDGGSDTTSPTYLTLGLRAK